MPDDSSVPQPTPPNYQRTTGGDHLRWQPPSPDHLQEMLPAYEILSILGQGGMGAVYKGRQKSLDRIVAIKILPPEAGVDDMQFVERFKNEARTMAKMNHPAIVHVYDFGETSEGQLYIVMEFIDGTDVAKMIQSQGKLPEDYALSITAHVCDALGYAHTQGIVHRDIKPANVLINMEGQVKVADFGLAKATDPSQMGLTKTNMAMGTPDFVSPEALMPGVPLDGRADLYAVGVMLYNMLTGTIPRGAFRMPSLTLNTDARFDKVISKAMEMDRELRYQTALDLRRDLDVILTTPAANLNEQAQSAEVRLPQKPVAQERAGPEQQHPDTPAQPVRQQGKSVAASPQPSAPKEKSSRLSLFIPTAVSAFVILGGAYFLRGKFTVTVADEDKPRVTTKSAAAPPPAAKPATPKVEKASSPTLDSAAQAPATGTKTDDVLTFGGHRYQLIKDNVKWDAAWSKAEALGGHLATITSKEEDDYLRDAYRHVLTREKNYIFIGGETENLQKQWSWKWVTGEPFDYRPEGFATSTKKHMLSFVLIDGKLAWKGDDTRRDGIGYIVEWDGSTPPSKPSPGTLAAASPASPVPSMPAAVPKPETSPQPPADPRLTQLEAGYQARYDSDAQKPFLAAVTTLNQSYVANGIGKARAAAQAKGSLNEVTALDAEKTLIEKGGSIPAEDATDTPESLKALRATYRTVYAKHVADREAKAAPLLDLYIKALDAYVAELTKAGKIDEAKTAQAVRNEKAATKESAAVPAKTAAPAPAVPAPAVTTPNHDAAPTAASKRQLAEWVLSRGGNLRLAADGGKRIQVKKLDELPVGKLDILEVTLPGEGAPESGMAMLKSARDLEYLRIDGGKDLNLEFLRDAKKLLTLNLPTSAITAEGWQIIGSLRNLHHLNFNGGDATDEQLAQLAGLESLEKISMNQTPSGTGFAGMKASKKLRALELGMGGTHVTNEGLAVIASTFPNLEDCHLANWNRPSNLTNEGLTVLLPLKSLKKLDITGKNVDDGAVETLSKLTGLKSMSVKGTSISADGVERLRKALRGCSVVN